MAKKGILIFLVLVLLIIASCAAKNPKDTYLSYIEKSQKTSEYKIIYKFDLTMLQALGTAFDIKLGTFKKNSNEKVVVEMNAFGQNINYYIYKLDGKYLSCTKGVGIFGGSQDKITCSKDAGPDAQQFNQLEEYTLLASKLGTDDLQIKHTGDEEAAGRKCDKFVIDIKDVSSLLNISSNSLLAGAGADLYKGLSAVMSVCMDKKTGLPLKLNVSTKSKSELDENEKITPLIALTATSFTEKVDDSVFTIPVKFSVLGVGCEKNTVMAVIEPYVDYSGQLVLSEVDSLSKDKKKKSVNVNSNLKKGKAELITAALERTNAYSSMDLCLGEECQNLLCSAEPLKCIKHSNSKAACESSSECLYDEPLCEVFNCAKVTEEAKCASKGCAWQDSFGYGYCYEKQCYDMITEQECKSSKLNCAWLNGYCATKTCYDLASKGECESSNLNCEWVKKVPDGNFGCSPFSCYGFLNQNECEASGKCLWSSGYCYNNYPTHPIPID
ncbi:hypothetical protein HY637_00540 [Candidatus Woesearchaeota archaeon]|nr:hypothetical protein [Candidatus Woesearchaeota archaeon]